MDIDTIIDQSAVDHLFQLFALATCLVMFWFLESVYRLDKRWLLPIVIFPISIFLFIIIHWEESRSKCFFASLLFLVMLLVGGLIGYSFFVRILTFFSHIAFWPFYLYMKLNPHLRA
ncbi:MAG TPA: hypothetical protein VLG38_05380 [Gammaproteobacteria bacterium]|nr:hypothetical protein [Gammaproteobacteria bacterium]